MYRYASLTAVLAALLLPSAATAADVGSPADLMAVYFGDQEISLAAPVNAPAAAAAAAATRAPDYDLSANLAVQDPLAQPDQFATLSDEELSGQRGGFMTPLGLEVGFGAIVRTTIDGALALEQTLTVTDQGVVRDVTAGALTPDLVAAAAAGGINLDPSANLAGVVSPGADGGATAVLTDVGNNFLNSLVINTANNRQVTQDTQINLNIPAFSSFQQTAMGAQMLLRFDQELGSALAASLPH
jgi:hypothetical protein